MWTPWRLDTDLSNAPSTQDLYALDLIDRQTLYYPGYVGQTAFGVRRGVEVAKSTVYGIAVEDRDANVLDYSTVANLTRFQVIGRERDFKWTITPSEAQAVKPFPSLIARVKVMPKIYTTELYSSPALEHPTDHTVTGYHLATAVEQLVVFDSRTGQVVKTFTDRPRQQCYPWVCAETPLN